jgi:hypothetical protein
MLQNSQKSIKMTRESIKSNIHPEVLYVPKQTVYSEDCNIELSVYEIQALGKEFIIALGKPKYSYSSRGVIFVPIYFVPSDIHSPKIQIGIYEYEKDRAISLLDKDGDLNIHDLVPIFFPWTDDILSTISSKPTEYLTKSAFKTPKEDNEEEETKSTDDTESSEDDDIFHLSKTKNVSATVSKKPHIQKSNIFTVRTLSVPPPVLPVETKDMSQEIKKSYNAYPQEPWIQTFMKNPHYQIHEVENNGDCLFATIRDAFKSIGYDTTVDKLREILVQEVTPDIFQENRKLYLDLEGSKKEYDTEIEKIKQGNTMLKNRFKLSNTKERQSIREELQNLTQKYAEVLENKQTTETIIKETMGNISKIDTFEKYKQFLKTTSFWADSWAISTLEKVLNIKIIIFSRLYYEEKAMHSVLNCGEINKALEKQGKFNPEHYIMVTYDGSHYNLLSYKNKKILSFPEIPYDVKTMIVNKCIERNAGIYYLIEDFRNFKMELGIQPDVGSPEDEPEDETELDASDLYDPTVVFRFFAKSEQSPLPGKGAGESIPADKVVEYKSLKSIPNWRRKLDDSWTDIEHPFMIDGLQYASVEHYYQSSKFRFEHAAPSNLQFATLFALKPESKESKESEIATDVLLATAAGSKSGKWKSKSKDSTSTKKDILLRPKEVVMDPQFYAGRHIQERMRGLHAKFTQIPEYKKILELTKRAKLVHYIAKQPPEVDIPLMKTRISIGTQVPIKPPG